MLTLHLTCDYEVFGNGSGDVNTCVIQPSEMMMEICEAFDTRMTYYVEVCEIWAFEDIEHQSLFSEGYTPATWIKDQLRNFIRRGHDVQLHLHPQWLEYTFHSDQKWTLNYDLWRLPDLEHIPGYGKGYLQDLISRGKEWLENLLRPIDPNYQCRSFRTGAWCIQPEESVLQALRSAGITKDSTLAPGFIFDDGLTKVDFSQEEYPKDPYYPGKTLGDQLTEATLCEIPIHTNRLGSVELAYYHFLSLQKGLTNNANGCSGSPVSRGRKKGGILSKLRRELKPQYKMLDFCGKNSFELMRRLTLSKIKSASSQDLPLVAIGHPKNFGNPAELRKYLAWCKEQSSIELPSLKSGSFWQS